MSGILVRLALVALAVAGPSASALVDEPVPPPGDDGVIRLLVDVPARPGAGEPSSPGDPTASPAVTPAEGGGRAQGEAGLAGTGGDAGPLLAVLAASALLVAGGGVLHARARARSSSGPRASA